MIAYSYCLNNFENDDEIILCDMDHKSTVLPFFNIVNILKGFGKNIKINNIPIHEHGDYVEPEIFSKVNEKTKMIILTHIHNMYGIEMNIDYIIENVRKINPNVIIVLDASQSIGHIKIDVSKLDVDMLFFSGHKMMSIQGVGILYIKKDLEKFKPFLIGGNFKNNDIKKVKSPKDLENGTLNVPAILSLKEAINSINELTIEKIEKNILVLTRYLYDSLSNIEAVEFNKGLASCDCRAIGYGIISFKINGHNSSEIGDILKDYNIIVRTGDFCSTSLNDDFIRISLYYYNTKEEIDKFIQILKYIIYN